MYINKFLFIINLFNICIVIIVSFRHITIFESSSHILGNVSDILVDIGEEVLLECDGDLHTNVSYVWYRKEENWFNEEAISQRIFFNQKLLLVNENKILTVLYKCISKPNNGPVLVRSFRLYVDRIPRAKREVQNRCLPPKCKPYASVMYAKCDTVELNITYPNSQHGYNRSSRIWGTVLCNDEIGGFQIWVVGHGILKRFLPRDIISIENLQPGRTYCFNGWAYNSCGAGPVFTLEGVCTENSRECVTSSTEHCEYDNEYDNN